MDSVQQDIPICIVFADMVGYSAMTARSESQTHTMWMDFTESCLKPVGAEHNARIMRLLGDGCLISFEHPSEALNWAQSVRAAIMSDRAKTSPRWPGISMRFGLHYCDVIHDNAEVYGDGVNTAKRLQERAQADGILLTDSVHEQLDAEPGEFRFLGTLSFKNLEQTVPTYEVIFADADPVRRDSGSELPSIAVLPFRNLTNNDEYDYFAEGVIDDIIFSLSGLKELHVISRGSTVAFAKKTIDPRDAARLLSVRYILQGSIRSVGEIVRLSVSFEDAQTGETIFGEKCEFPHRELFDIQDNIVRKIVSRVAPNVRALELEGALRKPAGNFTAYQCTLRALDLMRTLNREDFLKAKEHLDRAMELDPDFVLPIAWAVRWHTINIGQHWSNNRIADIEATRALAAKAVNIDRQNPLALAAYGHVKSYLERDYTTAMVYFDRARQVGPSHAIVWILSSATLAYLGNGDEAVQHAHRGLELSPNDYELTQFYSFLCFAHYCNRDYEEAYTWAKLSESENPYFFSTTILQIACSTALGLKDKTKEHVKSLLAFDPTFTVAKHMKTCPIQDEAFRESYFGHLSQSSLPQE